MLAIVDLNGKQYQVEEGRYVTVDRLALDENETLELANVMMIVDGEASLVGAPFVDGATVKAKVLRHTRGPKVLVYKMRRKKGYRRLNGHRQDYTQLQIDVVDFPGKQDRPAKKEDKAEQPKKAAAKTDKPKVEKKTTAKASTKTEKAAKPVEAEEVKVQQPQAEEAQAPQAAETQPETAATEENTEA